MVNPYNSINLLKIAILSSRQLITVLNTSFNFTSPLKKHICDVLVLRSCGAEVMPLGSCQHTLPPADRLNVLTASLTNTD